MIKLIYCIDSLIPSGGTERVLTTKINWLAEQSDCEAVVVTLKEKQEPFFTLSARVKRVMLDVQRDDRKGYRKALSEYLEEYRPDVCVAVSGMSSTILPQLKDGSKKVLEFHYTKNFLVNFVKGIHHLRFRQLHLLKMHWLQWQLAQQAKQYDCFVGLTQRDVALWGNPRNMTYIYNPLSFRSERKSTCIQKRIIAVGSWTPAKGMDQLLKAFGPLAKKYPDWKVDLYGSGQDEQLLCDLIAQYQMADQVTLHAPVPNIGEKLLESSIYAFPSRSDGFGLVITEAMECGLPTVAMDCECGPREIVTSDTGIVVPDKDIRTFGAALERLMQDEGLRQSMGKAASIQVERFYVENIMPKWVKLFKNLVK